MNIPFGLRIQSSTFKSFAYIDNNKMDDVYYGIYLNSVGSIIPKAIAITNNEIHVNAYNVPLNYLRAGVYLRSVQNGYALGTNKVWPNDGPAVTSPLAHTNLNLKSYHIESSTNGEINCNESHRMGIAFYIAGNCDLSQMIHGGFLYNQMDDDQQGLYLSGVNATIGEQGSVQIVGNPLTFDWTNFNKWTNNTFAINSFNGNHGNTFAYNLAQGNYSMIYYPGNLSGGIYIPTLNKSAVGGFPMTPTSVIPPSTDIDNCNFIIPHYKAPHDEDVTYVTGKGITTNYIMPDEAYWNGLRGLYEFYTYNLEHSPDEMGEGADSLFLQLIQNRYHANNEYVTAGLADSSITLLFDWYKATYSSNIRKFYEVDQLLVNGDIEGAFQLNESINPSEDGQNYTLDDISGVTSGGGSGSTSTEGQNVNGHDHYGLQNSFLPSHNQRLFNIIYLTHLLSSTTSTPEDSIIEENYPQENITDLQWIAVQCPVYGGRAVYQARALLEELGIEYGPLEPCEPDSSSEAPRLAHLTKPFTTATTLVDNSLRLFPNPTSDQFTLYGKDLANGKVRVLDLSGKELICPKILQKNNDFIIFDVQCLPAGLFTLEVISKSGKHYLKLIKL